MAQTEQVAGSLGMQEVGGLLAHPCRYCGAYHGPACPRVKAIEYHPNGAVKRVELFPPSMGNGAR